MTIVKKKKKKHKKDKQKILEQIIESSKQQLEEQQKLIAKHLEEHNLKKSQKKLQKLLKKQQKKSTGNENVFFPSTLTPSTSDNTNQFLDNNVSSANVTEAINTPTAEPICCTIQNCTKTFRKKAFWIII